MDPNNPNIIYTGYGNVWKSTNQGTNWTKISSFPNIAEYGKPAIISALNMCPTDPKYIYVAKRIHHAYNSPSSFWRTMDGSHWDLVTNGLPDDLYFTYIAVDDDNPLSVWVSCSGFEEGKKVYYSADGGNLWENISFDLPNIPINTIVHQNGSGENIIYIGTDAGIYYTMDGWNKWELYSTDLPNVIVSELEIHYPTKKLYAATFGRGIWMADVIVSTKMDDITLSAEFLDVFPNPSNGQINVTFTGLPSDIILIEVVDIQGKQVHHDQFYSDSGSGLQNITLDAPSGVYFVRLWAGERLRTARIIIE